jgi:hypothetical protein
VSAAFDREARRAVWRAHGATAEEADELLAYAASPLDDVLPARSYPLPDPPHVAAWERYADEARAEGAFATLRRVLVQLRFPVRAGTSEAAAYQAATRRGVLPADDQEGVALVRPDGLRVFLHATPAGRVPVLLAEAREDFETLVQALTRRNEPEPVPAAMGACMIAGYNNWERVRELRRAWEDEHAFAGEAEWQEAFRALIPQKALYQDRFILLSAGPYSSTPAAAVGMEEAAWRAASVTLRLEHECTHYFMRQAFDSMRKSLLDELVADYMGLVEAFGAFRADRFLLFMGLESYPAYRAGGRLENYRGAPPLSDGAFRVLPRVVKRAADTLDRLDPSGGRRFSPADKARVITALTRTGLEGLAFPQPAPLLTAALDEAAAASRAVVQKWPPGVAEAGQSWSL